MFSSLKILPLVLITLFSLCSIALSQVESIAQWALSPLVIAIIIGMILGNTVRNLLPTNWNPSIIFATKQLLRLGIILYGFTITFWDIVEVGFLGIAMAGFMLFSTFVLALFIGKKILKLDTHTSILVGAGSSICGAAAVLATESTLKNSPEKTSVAIATVVVFGTIAMFFVPFLFQSGVFSLSGEHTGVYVGAVVHEVAQVVGAGNIIGDTTAQSAVIVKMTRVMLLVPFLFCIGLMFQQQATTKSDRRNIFSVLPGFALLFIVVIIFHSLIALPSVIEEKIIWLDTLVLTMAMFALGVETNIKKFAGIGGKAFILAGVLFLWLIFGGYGVIKIFA